jgi:hypothetical protein
MCEFVQIVRKFDDREHIVISVKQILSKSFGTKFAQAHLGGWAWAAL